MQCAHTHAPHAHHKFVCLLILPLFVFSCVNQSIKERLELHTAKRDEEYLQQTPTKLSKKEKKKQKEAKKLAKQKKIDADKVS